MSRRAQMRRKMSLKDERVAGENERRSQISRLGVLVESNKTPFYSPS